MELSALAPTLIELETDAAYAHAMAAVAEHLAWRARLEADRKQAMLSEVEVFLALLPDDAALELLAIEPDAADPAQNHGACTSPWMPRAGDHHGGLPGGRPRSEGHGGARQGTYQPRRCVVSAGGGPLEPPRRQNAPASFLIALR